MAGSGLEGHAAGGDVEVFEADKFLAGFADGFDGGVVGVGVVDQCLLDRFVVTAPIRLDFSHSR